MLFNGFQKKKQKTPKGEIDKALRIKNEYYAENKTIVRDFDQYLDEEYGAIGTEERTKFEEEAKAFYTAQILLQARKDAKVTQSELAQRVGTTKSYISKIENGVIEPSVGLFFRLINALGLRIDITNSIGV